jgi:hypothetical protein
MLALAIMVAAIQIVPTLELVRTTSRATSNYSQTTDGVLELRTLPTLVAPDWLGAISGKYTGPADVTQYYFYAGFLLLPLAALGLAKTRTRLHALFLIVPAAWFMLGNAAGLYRLALLLPGMNKVREPIQGWFVVALGLAVLAAAGFAWLERRWRSPYLGAILIAILFVDVWYWNVLENPLAYGHFTFDSAYGDGEDALLRHVATRGAAAYPFLGGRRAPVGLQNYGLDLHLETTAGYAALPIGDYIRYLAVMKQNPNLRDGLNISTFLTADSTGVESNASVLPRVYFPKSIMDVGTGRKRSARSRPSILDCSRSRLCRTAPFGRTRRRRLPCFRTTKKSYRIRYHAASPALLRLSVPYYPGWRATVDGQQLPIVHVDLALMGVVVPAGDRELQFSFRSDSFGIGVGYHAGRLGPLFTACGRSQSIRTFLALAPP